MMHTVGTPYGNIRVSSETLREWNADGWPPPEILQRLAEALPAQIEAEEEEAVEEASEIQEDPVAPEPEPVMDLRAARKKIARLEQNLAKARECLREERERNDVLLNRLEGKNDVLVRVKDDMDAHADAIGDLITLHQRETGHVLRSSAGLTGIFYRRGSCTFCDVIHDFRGGM